MSMNPKCSELGKQCAFDSYCKKVLRNDARNYFDEVKRQREKEVFFSELSKKELAQLSRTDSYFSEDRTFDMHGSEIVVCDDGISDALLKLPRCKRDIILLSYFLELSDVGIGKILNLARSTVQYQRAAALKELRKIMEGIEHEG